MGLFSKKTKEEERATLDSGLAKTKESFFQKLSRSILGKSTVDDDVLDNLEETLITSDVGVETTLKVIEKLQERIRRDKYISTSELNSILRAEIAHLLIHPAVQTQFPATFDAPLPHTPYVILVVGVNGVGKTTTIAKLAYRYKEAGRSVVLGAADTFRAAAVEQLDVWCRRAGAEMIAEKEGADPASVVYNTISAAKAKNADMIIIDTAGRLQNKKNLKDERAKIRRVIARELPDTSVETLLVIDGTTGQNDISQAEEFTAADEVTAIAVTKLVDAAKGGVTL